MKKALISGGVIALLLVLIVSSAGCTTTTTTSPSPSPTASAATHDTLLQSLAATDYNNTAKNYTITSWDVLWPNSTTVKIQASISNSSQNQTASVNETFMRFPSNDAATAYLNTYNSTGYTYSSPTPTTDILYYQATGRLPTVFQGYTKTSSENYFVVTQTDDVIQILELNTA
jgi:hypothetical protein